MCIRDRSNDKLGYQETNGTAIWNLAFNVNVEPFDDVKVRKALAMAVKRDDIIAGAKMCIRDSAYNVQSCLMHVMERLKAEKIRTPENLKDWGYVEKILRENNCWVTGIRKITV